MTPLDEPRPSPAAARVPAAPLAGALATARCGALALVCWLVLTPLAVAQLDADFTVDVTAGTNPLTVQFTDATTGGVPFVWSWEFGDGHVSNQQNPSHTYTLPGNHTVTLSVIGPGLQIAEETKAGLITVAPQPLSAGFSASATQGTNPLTVQFTDTSTGNPPTAWQWDFGDGAQSTAQHPTHVYATPGTFDVSLTVFIDQQWDSATQAGLITVDPTTLSADFTLSATGGDSPLAVTFTDASAGGAPITARLWDFGDGSTSTATNPTHTYDVQTEASFDVSLTVSIGGQSATKTVPDAVTVEPGLFAPEAVLKLFATQDVRLYDAADLDGDGRRDLLAFLEPSLANDGDLVFLPHLDEPTAFGAKVLIGPHLPEAPVAARAADLDGDGDPDVVSTIDGEVTWVEHLDGAGGFEAFARFVGDSGSSAALWDLMPVDADDDGDLDVFGGGNVGIVLFENLGGGSFAPVLPIETDLGIASLDVADLDGDGDLDLVAAGSDALPVMRGLFWWARVDGPDPYDGPRAVHEHVTYARWTAAGDLDGDGDMDLVGRYVDQDFVPLGYRAYENVSGLGDFASLQSVFWSEDTAASFLLDPDGDGDLDLIDVRRTAAPVGGLWWAENRGGSTPLEPIRQLSIVDFATYPLFTDLDDDGDEDLVSTFFDLGDEGIAWSANRLGSVAWPFLGDGLQGVLGMPRLQGQGALSGGTAFTLRVTSGPPGANPTLVAGLSPLEAPFKGGVLVPFPDLILPLPPLDGDGRLTLVETWPVGIPAGIPLWFQCWITDASGPVGFSASNAVTATTQP